MKMIDTADFSNFSPFHETFTVNLWKKAIADGGAGALSGDQKLGRSAKR